MVRWQPELSSNVIIIIVVRREESSSLTVAFTSRYFRLKTLLRFHNRGVISRISCDSQMNDINTRGLRNQLHAPATMELGLLTLEMHPDGHHNNTAFCPLRVGRIAENRQDGWVAQGCDAHISLFAFHERPPMGAEWEQQCNRCRRILFEFKLLHGPMTTVRLQGMEREDRDLAVIEILQDEPSEDLLQLLYSLREVFHVDPEARLHLTVRSIRDWTANMLLDRSPSTLVSVSERYYRRRDQILNTNENYHRMLRGKQRLGDQTRLDDPTYRYSNVNIQIAVESMAVIGDRLIAECCFELERELANIPGTRHTIF